MDSFAPRLPTVFGSAAALVVGFVSSIVQVSPLTCLYRAFAAFILFSAFGIVIRYLLAEAGTRKPIDGGDWLSASKDEDDHELGAIPPGTSVADLLGEGDHLHPATEIPTT